MSLIVKNLKEVSVYYLLLEALNDGAAGLLPSIEPIPIEHLIAELTHRTGVNNNETVLDWAKWFLGSDVWGSELERANLLIFLKTQESMSQIWQKISSRPT